MKYVPQSAWVAVMAFSSIAAPVIARGGIVTLQQATATFSQSLGSPPYNFSVSTAIDGVLSDDNGWAIATSITAAQTAVFETAGDVGYLDGTQLTFQLYQYHMPVPTSARHLIGRFLLSSTTADRSLFADGIDGKTSPGVVGSDSIWTPLIPISVVSLNGATLSILGDHSILSSGLLPDQDTYTVTAETSLTGITGFRLQVLEDPSLPTNGPGRALNGTSVECELQTVRVAVHAATASATPAT